MYRLHSHDAEGLVVGDRGEQERSFQVLSLDGRWILLLRDAVFPGVSEQPVRAQVLLPTGKVISSLCPGSFAERTASNEMQARYNQQL